MAVNINTVYQTVLALANKEQRGYITPQEFNLFAAQAQMSIFEQYFYDLNQFSRIPGNNTSYADMTNLLKEKISFFERNEAAVGSGTNLPQNLYKLQQVQWLNPSKNRYYTAEYVSNKDFLQMQSVSLIKPTDEKLVYTRNSNGISVFGDSLKQTNVICNFVEKPKDPNWTYVVVDKKALYNPSAIDHQNFQLHSSEQTELVTRILALAGITLKDVNLYQVASNETKSQAQEQKQ
jgi:hypothetical protein